MTTCSTTPHRLLVLQRLTALLEEVSPMNGFEFDLSKSIRRGRIAYGANDPETMVSILEAPRPDFGDFAGGNEVRSDEWTLLVQGWTPDDSEHPTDRLYYLARDVETALAAVNARAENGSGNPRYPEHFLLGPNPDDEGHTLIADFVIGPPVVRPATEAQSKAFFYITLRIRLLSNTG